MINELTESRGSHIFDIEFDSGSEFRVAANTIEDALIEVKEYCEKYDIDGGKEFGKYDYILKARVRTEDFDHFNEFDYDI